MTSAIANERAPASARRFARDVGAIVVSWMVLIALENAVVGRAFQAQFAGPWEMAHAWRLVSPIAVAVALPAAVIFAAVGWLVAHRKTYAVVLLAAFAGTSAGIGVSAGRHFASLTLRIPFVAVVILVASGLAFLATRHAQSVSPRRLAAEGAGICALAWLGDSFLLPRLYPAAHLVLFVFTLGGAAHGALVLRPLRIASTVACLAITLSLVSAALTPRLARALTADDNLRRVLVEHAPILGRTVLLASKIAPPPSLDEPADAATAAILRPGAAPRALDWTGRDIVLITIDALRADHVSAYGYERATTPNIDRLAARGARFERAYCPTPHTSYSVASMMTGTYMRPLLAQGVQSNASETWASYLRAYGFRTAAFYPPAVFFIDEHRFRRMKEAGLNFEYRKEEFADPALRLSQIGNYLQEAPLDKPVFLWVHLFEPHEPYVRHPEHVFGAGDHQVDAYDSEIAAADRMVGDIVDVVDRRKPGAVFIVSADHGEEFGDHGGRYHGTTVYEEQVRVPLVVVAPGVSPTRIEAPAQTIDLLPTTLAALDIPMPARVRGRDLGAMLTGAAASGEQGLAFAETDDYTLVARGHERLVCMRKIGSCSLFDLQSDPLEKSPVLGASERVKELRRLTVAIERENGRLEAPLLPEALRRGLSGDRDAAEDVAALLDDADVLLRREAARCAFRLQASPMIAQLRRAHSKDEDEDVRRWALLALVRHGEQPTVAAQPLVHHGNPDVRLAAALALAERGDARGEEELVNRWQSAFVPNAREPGELEEGRQLLAALVNIRSHGAVPALVRALEDVRLRPFVAEALGNIGDPRALGPLLRTFGSERYIHMRPKEARALVQLGAREAMLAPLRRFAGVPDGMSEAVEVARDAGLLTSAQGGFRDNGAAPGSAGATVTVTVVGTGAARLLAIARDEANAITVRVDGEELVMRKQGNIWSAELPSVGSRAKIGFENVAAFWIVRRAEEILSPAADDKDAGRSEGRSESGL